MSSMEKETAKELVLALSEKKQELLKKGQITKKRDKLKYPIIPPFKIPKYWEWTYLANISIIQEGPGIRKYQYTKEGMQFLTVTNILEGDIDFKKSMKYISIEEYENKYQHFKINRGDIVTACSGGSWGKSAIFNYDYDMILNTSTLRLRFFGDLGNNKYLYYLTKSDYFKKNLSSHSTGQQPNYGYSHYSQIPIPIPPLTEQQKIVTLLDEAFAQIDRAKANIEQNIVNAKELFQSKLNEIFSQRGEGWEEKSLGELSTRIGDGLHGTPKYDNEGDYFFINGNNLNNGTIEIKERTKRVNYEEYLKHKKELTNNTVLVSINGTLGKVAFYDNEKVILGKSACYINLKHFVNKHFIKYLIKSPLFFENMAKQSTGATIKNFSLRSMRNYKLYLPNTDIQFNIVKMLELLEKDILAIEKNYHQKLENLEELKKSLLEKAFQGALTRDSMTAS